jgi:hypothetical protein
MWCGERHGGGRLSSASRLPHVACTVHSTHGLRSGKPEGVDSENALLDRLTSDLEGATQACSRTRGSSPRDGLTTPVTRRTGTENGHGSSSSSSTPGSSSRRVSRSSSPETDIPYRDWKARTAACVSAVKMPSTGPGSYLRSRKCPSATWISPRVMRRSRAGRTGSCPSAEGVALE